MCDIKTYEDAFRLIWINNPNIVDGESCVYCGGNWDTPIQEGIPGNHESGCEWVIVYRWLQRKTEVKGDE